MKFTLSPSISNAFSKFFEKFSCEALAEILGGSSSGRRRTGPGGDSPDERSRLLNISIEERVFSVKKEGSWTDQFNIRMAKDDAPKNSDVDASLSLTRSADMSLIQLYIPAEAVQMLVVECGSAGCVQFVDLCPQVTAFQRPFTAEIRRLDETERVVRFLIDHCSRENVSIRRWFETKCSLCLNTTLNLFESDHCAECEASILASNNKPSLLNLKNASIANPRTSIDEMNSLDSLAPILSECEDRVLQLEVSQKELLQRFLHTLEHHSVLVALDQFFNSNPRLASSSIPPVDDYYGSTNTFNENTRTLNSIEEATIPSEKTDANFVTGAISKRKMEAFQRVLWRALRGNVFVRSADISMDTREVFSGININNNSTVEINSGSPPNDEILEPRSAFVAYVHGADTVSRLRKICQVLGATLHEVRGGGGADERLELDAELRSKLDDLYSVLCSTRQAKRSVLGGVSRFLERALLLTVKKKLVLDTMNLFSCDNTRKYYIAEAWTPTCQLSHFETLIKTSTDAAGLSVAPVLTVLSPGNRTVPTHFPTNSITSAFQGMTESYGIATFGEFNPSVFMVFSLPFFFAVMFGDVGHAIIVMSIAIVLVYMSNRRETSGRNSQKMDDTTAIIYGGRYVILLMGIFSIITGLIYNDIFSLPLTIFSSAYNVDSKDYKLVRKNESYVYPLGVDPLIILSDGALIFLNSYKMKQAVIFGVLQMFLGVCISALNFIHDENHAEIFCTFIPQITFMLCIPGYLVFLIFHKWIFGWDMSILSIMITMIRQMGAVESQAIYFGQKFVQTILFCIAMLCVPWMFFAKPLYLMYQHYRIRSLGYLPQPSSPIEIERKNPSNQETRPKVQYSPVDTRSSTTSLDGISNLDSPSAIVNKADYENEYQKQNNNLEKQVDNDAESVSSTTLKATNESQEKLDSHDTSEIWVHQLIHTIEFVLGSVSNTASYLRLWALSLAHSQLSHVVWSFAISKSLHSPILLIICYPIWLLATILVLVGMEGMSAFLHALRLHWVEFNNKFYGCLGVKFVPFSLDDEQVYADLVDI